MENSAKTIEVCYSPALFPLFEKGDAIVVVVDVLRATSSICVAFANGADHVIPVKTIEESLAYKESGYIIAAERNGEMIEGFDCGNSPFSYMGDKIKGSKIAVTTTNGTQAINAAKKAHKVVIGSFLNLDLLAKWLIEQNKNVICLCAGWKNKFNMEDTLFAGALVALLRAAPGFECFCDSSIAAEHLYNLARKDLVGFLSNSSHRKRLARLNIEKDVEYCLTLNQANVIPVLEGEKLINILV